MHISDIQMDVGEISAMRREVEKAMFPMRIPRHIEQYFSRLLIECNMRRGRQPPPPKGEPPYGISPSDLRTPRGWEDVSLTEVGLTDLADAQRIANT